MVLVRYVYNYRTIFNLKTCFIETSCADMPNKERDCKYWYDASSNWCHYINMTSYMHRTCSKSCGFCGEEEAGITISFYLLLLISQSSAQQWICYVKSYYFKLKRFV